MDPYNVTAGRISPPTWSGPTWTPLAPSAGLVANMSSGTFSYSSINGQAPNTAMLDSMSAGAGQAKRVKP